MQLQALRTGDEPGIRRVFWATWAAGSPSAEPPAAGRYAELCLGWYLREGRDEAAVLRCGGQVVGYALVCVDESALRRWQQAAALRWAAEAALVAARPRMAYARGFLARRARDALMARRALSSPPMPAHGHLAVLPGHRRRTGRGLLAHVDARCAAAGHPGWYGELVARRGRRAIAAGAAGSTVVARLPSATWTWLRGEPVDRLVVVRPLATATVRPLDDGDRVVTEAR